MQKNVHMIVCGVNGFNFYGIRYSVGFDVLNYFLMMTGGKDIFLVFGGEEGVDEEISFGHNVGFECLFDTSRV